MRLRRSARLTVAGLLLVGAPAVLAAERPAAPAALAPERERLLEQVVERNDLVTELRGRFGPRLGPTYYADAPRGRVFVVGVRDLTPADERVVRQLVGRPGLVEVRPARFSRAELGELAARVGGHLRAIGVRDATVAVPTPMLPERLVVGVASPLSAGTQQAVRRLVPVPVEFRRAGPFRLTHGTSRADYPPYEAALNLVADHTDSLNPLDWWFSPCATGFAAYSETTRKYYGLTAGHCGPRGSDVFVGRSLVGSQIDQNGYYDNNDLPVASDSARFPIPKKDATARIARGADLHLTLNGIWDLDHLLDYRLGKRLCWNSNVTDRELCGPLAMWLPRLDFAPEFPAPFRFSSNAPPARTLKDVLCIEMKPGNGPQLGDSGAPVYHVDAENSITTGAGLIFNTGRFTADDGSTVEMACFQALDALESRLDVEIIYDGWFPYGQSNGTSHDPVLSGDGRYVAFTSYGSNLVPGDTNGTSDVFVRDTSGLATERVSVSSAEAQGNGRSEVVDVSPDGRYVLFDSEASNLVAGDTNGAGDVFVRDRQTGTTTRVSVGLSGRSGWAWGGSITADGRYATFMATTSRDHVYLRDLKEGTTTLVSVDSAEQPANESSSGPSAVSADGRYVAFASDATNLGREGKGWRDVFVRDRTLGTTTLVSVSSDGLAGDGHSAVEDISDDGRHVLFSSMAGNLVPGDTNMAEEVFLHDRLTGTTTRVSVDSAEGEAEHGSRDARMSSTGRYVAFYSTAPDLVAGDTNGIGDYFVRDTVAGTTVRVSVSSTGQQQTAGTYTFASLAPGISGDGRQVAFPTAAPLAHYDTNRHVDVYRRGWSTGTTSLVSRS